MPTHSVELIPWSPDAIVFQQHNTLGDNPSNVMDFGMLRTRIVYNRTPSRLDTGYKIRVPAGLQARIRPHPYLVMHFPALEVGRPYVFPEGEHQVDIIVSGTLTAKGQRIGRGFPIIRLEMQYAPVIGWQVGGVQYKLPAQAMEVILPLENTRSINISRRGDAARKHGLSNKWAMDVNLERENE